MSILRIHIEHSVLPIKVEKRFDSDTKISTLKDKLYIITGTKPDDQRLELKDDQKTLCVMLDESKTLGQYGAMNDFIVRVVDIDPFKTTSQFSNVDAIEKYTISEEDYNKRDDTFRKWKERNVANTEASQPKEEKEIEPETEPSEDVQVGARCEVQNSGKPRGTIQFVGKTKFADGYWVGVQLDEPVGKNNGNVKGVQYFTCEEGYGIFVKPNALIVGDFPEEDLGFSSDEDEI